MRNSVDGGCGGSKIEKVKVEEMSSLHFITWLGDILNYILKVILPQWLCCFQVHRWCDPCGSLVFLHRG